MKLRHFHFLLISVILNSSQLNAQSTTFEWARKITGISDEVVTGIVCDANGDIYTTGYFFGTVDFDPGPGSMNLTTSGNSDIFIQKLAPNGTLIWAKNFGSVSDDEGHSITIDEDGNIYTTGYFAETVDFNPGAGINNLSSNNNFDVFVLKLDSNGDFLWAVQMGGSNNDRGNSIIVGSDGNVYVSGGFKGTADFDPSNGIVSLSSNGNEDAFIQKIDPNGNLIWVKQMGGTDNDYSQTISVDAFGNIYNAGIFRSTVDFDPSVGISNLISNGLDDAFIQKLDLNGNFIWAKQIGGTQNDLINSIINDQYGNLYSVGSFELTVDLNPNSATSNHTSNGFSDIFIQKLDSSGSFIWAKQIGGSLSERGESICNDPSGNIYITGGFGSTVDFDPGVNTFNLASAGGWDIFIEKLDTNGNMLWVNNMGSAMTDYGAAITTDEIGNIITTGRFQNQVDFDPSVSIFNLTSYSNTDIFVQKMSQCPNFSTYAHTSCGSYTWTNGITYYASNNTASQLYMNSFGCDSIVTLNLTILNSNTTIDSITACDQLVWIDGETYTSSNSTATSTFSNIAGCDSVVTLNLTIVNSSLATDLHTECNSYNWIDGNTYTTSNDTATYLLTNSAGCDSIITLNLTILSPNYGFDQRTECNSFTWIDGVTYHSSNNTATHVIESGSTNGCDSIISLDLTINSVSDVSLFLQGTAITANNPNGEYQWLDCLNEFAPIPNETNQTFNPSINGQYAVEINENGCIDTSDCIYVSTVGIKNDLGIIRLDVYPNPNKGLFSIESDGLPIGNYHIRILNALGENVVNQTIKFERNFANVTEIDMQTSARGMYMLIIEGESIRMDQRVIIQ